MKVGSGVGKTKVAGVTATTGVRLKVADVAAAIGVGLRFAGVATANKGSKITSEVVVLRVAEA